MYKYENILDNMKCCSITMYHFDDYLLHMSYWSAGSFCLLDFQLVASKSFSNDYRQQIECRTQSRKRQCSAMRLLKGIKNQIGTLGISFQLFQRDRFLSKTWRDKFSKELDNQTESLVSQLPHGQLIWMHNWPFEVYMRLTSLLTN